MTVADHFPRGVMGIDPCSTPGDNQDLGITKYGFCSNETFVHITEGYLFMGRRKFGGMVKREPTIIDDVQVSLTIFFFGKKCV